MRATFANSASENTVKIYIEEIIRIYNMAKLKARKGVNVWQARFKDENGAWQILSTGVPITQRGVSAAQPERKVALVRLQIIGERG